MMSTERWSHIYTPQGLNYCFLKSPNPIVLLVARGGIEPPTHGFSVRFKRILLGWCLTVKN